MNINLHIERLVVDAALLGDGRREALHAAVEAELARLLAEGQLPAGRLHGAAIPTLNSAAIQIGAASNPAQLGAQIGQAVYGSLSQPATGSSR